MVHGYTEDTHALHGARLMKRYENHWRMNGDAVKWQINEKAPSTSES